MEDFAKHTIMFDPPAKMEGTSAWIMHTPLALFIVSILRPMLLVELGVHTGHSYNAFCQAVKTLKTATHCYGIDTWKGDEHAGWYGEDIYQNLLQYQLKEYAEFSNLLRMTFDEGLAYFSDNSIDLLHIDGLHTYEAVKHDFESWLPKMSDKGVILLHDTFVRERGFGVWRLWEEIASRYPSFNFTHGHGLGIAAVGPNVAKDFLDFLHGASEDSFYRKLFFNLGRQLTLDESVREKEGRIDALNASVREKDGWIAAEQDRLGKEIENLQTQLRAERCRAEDEIARLNDMIFNIYRSTSWRITAPVRGVGIALRFVVNAFKGLPQQKGKRSGASRGFLGAGWAHFSYLLAYVRGKPFFCLVKRFFYILATEGPSGIRLRHKLITAGLPYVDKQAADTRGFYKRHDRQPLSYEHIEKYEFVFLDVFDTAVLRLFLKPVDLFRYLEAAGNNPGFYERRVAAETAARKRLPGQRDICLAEIYRDLPADKMETEVRAEHKFCVANPEIFSLYSRAVAEGKKVCFVSDIYLDKETISDILKANGYNAYEDIFVSSEDDLIKGDGSRFQWLRDKIPRSIGAAVHIGDNLLADFEQPKKYGFDAIRYIDSLSYFRCDDFLFSKIDFLQARSSPGLSFIIANFRYWKSGLGGQPTYWRQFGFLYGGALVAAFCHFVRQYLSRRNISCRKIFFLARDGDIMSKVYRTLYDDVEAVYLLASRRCMALPSLNLNDGGDSGALRWFATPIGVRNADDVVERFGYDDLTEFEADLKECLVRRPQATERMLRRCILRHKNKIMEKAIDERSVLMDYLAHIGFLNESDIVVCDVGWNGTIQDALFDLLNISGYSEKQLHGIYMGVHAGVAHGRNKNGFLFEGDCSEFGEYLNFIELITSSPEDETIRIQRMEGSFAPVVRPFNEEENKRKLASEEIQKGIMDFTEGIKRREISNLDFLHPGDFKVLLDSLRDCPSEEDLKHFSRLKHAPIGHNYFAPVIGFNLSFIKLVVVFINPDMYGRFFEDNDRLRFYEKIAVDNRKKNRGLPVIYNEIIERYIHADCWLCFIHEDLEIKSDLFILAELDKNCVYGTFGVNFENQRVAVGYGKHVCSNKDGSDATEIGIKIHAPAEVQTLDCQCVIVHTSLLARYPDLRFDEKLTFDLYAEDFSINARERFGLPVKVVPLEFQHYSYGRLSERYDAGLRYLAAKYPDVAVAGSCSFIGGRASELEKIFKYNIRADADRDLK